MPSSAGRLAATIVILAVALSGAAGPVAAQETAESTVILIDLQADGDARWTVSARFALRDENESRAFQRLANEYLAGETDVLTVAPYRSAAGLASQATGRTMAIRAVDRTAGQGNGTGELRLSFTWTNFARVPNDGEQLKLGDVFTSPSGTWLPRLGRNQVLVIEFPEGYVVESVSRGLDNRSIRVTGPATFEPGKPSATLERGGTEVVTTRSPSPEAGTPSALTAGAGLAILLVVAILLYRRRQTESADGADETPPSEPVAEPPADEETADELLSDEERVLRLLRAEGGRMKQVDIVEETDWSNAKVSQLLSAMAEEGQIEKLRIGRENLITLPDELDE